MELMRPPHPDPDGSELHRSTEQREEDEVSPVVEVEILQARFSFGGKKIVVPDTTIDFQRICRRSE